MANNKKCLIEEKPIVDVSCVRVYMICMAVIMGVISIGFWLIQEGNNCFCNWIKSFVEMPEEISGTVMTMGMLFLSFFPMLVDRADTRIMGISYKAYFFKNVIWKWFNYPNVAAIMLIMMGLNIIAGFLEIDSLSWGIQIVALVNVFGLSCWLYQLSLIATVKKSRIYYEIKKKLSDAATSKEDPLVKLLLKKIETEKKPPEKEGQHHSYIYEEIGCLFYLAVLVKNHSNDNEDEMLNKVLKEIRDIIRNDDRDENYLMKNIESKAQGEYEAKREPFEECFSKLKELM